MTGHEQTIVSIAGTAMGLVMCLVAWRATPRNQSIEPDMERVARFIASAERSRGSASKVDPEIGIVVRIRRDVYRDARNAGLDLSTASEAGIRHALEGCRTATKTSES
ncbi:hypothetical protein [Cereibacter sediminicola]|uniref:hypothetical protein n=1 Tax=Cereibacter sediminicola TaxID=2584941 RepID=UPI0011A15DC2|nr:hypothetical protein [Cereibacter sediminicola]